MHLKTILDTLQQAANAIMRVLDVDVLIVDRDLVRLVATGSGSDQIGHPVDARSVFAYAMARGESFIIEDPRTHEACRYCGNKGACTELAELCCPIEVNGAIEGVIGLIAFDDDARNRMLERRESYLSFVREMAGLIASKAQETHQYQQTEKLASELETLVEQIGQGVLIADVNGQIIRGNSEAYRLLKSSRDHAKHLKELLPISCHKDGIPLVGEHTFTAGKGNGRLLCRVRTFQSGGELSGYILLFNRLNAVYRDMSRMMGYSGSVEMKDIIGSSKSIEQVRQRAKRAAQGSSTVLILGESGTGKELFARAIHSASNRASEPFVPINCGAIPDHLLESELFGYEEGAFSGARKGGKIGKFELADRGTLFLDEIGDMPLHLQTKLLRVLEERMIDRIGASERTPIDVRIIAATHQDLERRVQAKEFREDLYYRLNVIPIQIPPLRDRMEDLSILSQYFIEQIAGTRGESPRHLSENCLGHLTRWHWPGNVRELQNAIAYAAELSIGDSIEAGDLPERLRTISEDQPSPTATQPMIFVEAERENEGIVPLETLEQQEIQKALLHFGKDVEGAAKALGISRATLYRKLKLYGK